jgi:hypothetical protein
VEMNLLVIAGLCFWAAVGTAGIDATIRYLAQQKEEQ